METVDELPAARDEDLADVVAQPGPFLSEVARIVLFVQSAVVNVLETTYFGISFIFCPNGSSFMFGHAAAKPS